GHHLRDCVQQRLGRAAIVQSPPCSDGSRRVARLLGSTFLRLEQVDVSAARDVEGMSTRTEQPPLLAHQRRVAATDGAKKHASSLANGAPGIASNTSQLTRGQTRGGKIRKEEWNVFRFALFRRFQ